LFEKRVRPNFSEAEVQQLLGKRIIDLDPDENDLKALAAHAAARKLIDPSELRDALAADLSSAPLYFLGGLSGKTFGETIAPELCAFWLRGPGDKWEKKSNRELYDIAWAPAARRDPLRIELKASSEHPEYRFQQVRDPRAGGNRELDYDALLCLGVTASSLELWLIPATEVIALINDGTLTPQHGGKKAGLESNTYWFVTDASNRTRLRQFAMSPEELRDRAVDLYRRVRNNP
jgi:hypothetical protein